LTQYGPPFDHRFETLRWITYLFLGGALNAAVLEIFGDYLLHLHFPLVGADFWLLIILPLGLVFLTPVILSLAFSRFQPEKQIVPPLYIQLVSAGWFLGFIYVRWSADWLPILALELFYAWFGGTIQNVIAVWLLGLSTDRRNLIPYSLEISSLPEKVEQTLSTERFRDNLDLLNAGEERDDHRWEYIGGRKNAASRYGILVEVREGSKPESSLVNLVFYERTSYYVSPVTDDLREYASAKLAYLKSLFQKLDGGITVSELEPTNADGLINRTLDNMQGVVPQFGRISKLGWFKVGSFIGALVIAVADAVVLKDLPSSLALFALILLYLAFELGSGLTRKSKAG